MTTQEPSGDPPATYPALEQRPWAGGQVGELIQCVLAPNPGPYTLEGTNTWIIGDPQQEVLIVDPGPADDGHADRIANVVRSCPKISVLITHRHADHTDGIEYLASRIGQKTTYAASTVYTYNTDPVTDGTTISVGEVEVVLILTPGHTADSLSATIAPKNLVDSAPSAGPGHKTQRFLLSGDTILGRGTTVISATDGSLADYLASLTKLQHAVETLGKNRSATPASSASSASSWPVALLPGHGPALADAANTVAAYKQHRHRRLQAVAAAMDMGSETVEEITDVVYKNLDPALRRAAEDSVRAQRNYLLQHTRDQA